ncbi:ATP-binding protein [Aliiroseovarius subalbicans]|uniref:ATP-binding protein n=1 Tax=Aliiroseovarius subalbicans TaxID=2925840 RepID=UPI001F57B1B9|nr:ATP-binding protein [Aliiroseovarius subalbicans]MCI2398190.1 ATP-binding protein [Aliiroseovarius subalbicans]
MFWSWLKQFLPRGLYGRAAMILIVPVVSIQLFVSVVFVQRHFNGITVRMTAAVVSELDYLTRQVNAAPDVEAANTTIAALLEALSLRVDLPGEGPDEDAKWLSDFTGGLVTRLLREGVDGVQAVDLRTLGLVVMSIHTKHGPMVLELKRARVSASAPHQLLVLMVVAGLLLTIVSYLFLRNQLKPIRRLALASEAFGKGQVVPYKLAGATEVRSAGKAFLDMRGRIERQMEQRTLMLSGVSHDLRTPLTRMRLELSLLDEGEARAALERDVADMERLVDEFLSFARSDALEGEPEMVDPLALARDLAENAARAGQVVSLGRMANVGPMPMRPGPVARAVENLLSNANRYGSDVRLSVITGRRDLRFVVEDDGPGIAPADRDQAVKPFARLDAARNQDRGTGVGLGLAIADDIARGHGGRLKLGVSEDLGGLKAELILVR